MNNPFKPLTFVIISRQSWEMPLGSNIRDMARTLALNHRVLFVNEPIDWALSLTGNADRAERRRAFMQTQGGQHLIQVEKNLWVLCPQAPSVSINWLPDSPLYDSVNRIDNRRLAGEISKALAELNWSSFILLNDNDMLRGFYLNELLRPELYIYYQRDNLLAVNYWKRHGERLEPLLMQKADLIVNNSIHLARQAARYTPRSIDIGQGCDLSLFNPDLVTDEPADLANIPHPRIGYAGALTGIRLDVGLIRTIAIGQANWQIVLIGAADETFAADELLNLPNVHRLGRKKPADIPAYLAAMDVLINPQQINEVTVGNYPRKIDEYLAMGKPVVAVRTDTMALFDGHVFLADTADQFMTHIANALAGRELSSPAERIAFAHEHTWERSVGMLTDAIYPLLPAFTHQQAIH